MVRLPSRRGEVLRSCRCRAWRRFVLRVKKSTGGSPAARPQPPGHGERRTVIGMRDGSLLFAKSIQASDKDVQIELAGDVKLKGGAVDDIVALESLGGPVVYLSDLEGANYRHVPYLSISWPLMRDRNVLDEPIELGGKRYLKGIGMHSAARLTYRFDRDYQRFDSAVAIDDSAKGRGSVTFGAYVLRDGKWTEAYKSGIVRGGEAPLPVSIDLRGAQGPDADGRFCRPRRRAGSRRLAGCPVVAVVARTSMGGWGRPDGAPSVLGLGFASTQPPDD